MFWWLVHFTYHNVLKVCSCSSISFRNFLTFQGWITFYVCIYHFVFPDFPQWTLGLLPLLAIVNNAAMSTDLQSASWSLWQDLGPFHQRWTYSIPLSPLWNFQFQNPSKWVSFSFHSSGPLSKTVQIMSYTRAPGQSGVLGQNQAWAPCFESCGHVGESTQRVVHFLIYTKTPKQLTAFALTSLLSWLLVSASVLASRDFPILLLNLSRYDILEKAMAPHSSTLAWKLPRAEEPGRLQSMRFAKSRTWLSDFTFTFHFHALEKEMATHSSVLA